MSRMKIVGFALAALLAKGAFAPSPTIGAAPQLTVREEAGRVVLAWSGPIVKSMRDDVAGAIARFEADPRRLVVTLNSPGGSLEEGHRVMTVIGDAARRRRIDMRIEGGAVCASMCVPIYLQGTVRTADPDGQFMFHEVTLAASKDLPADQGALVADPRARKAIEAIVTDEFYANDLGGTRVDARWLRAMRARIVGRDVWASARQLVDEGSGIVDALVPAAAR